MYRYLDFTSSHAHSHALMPQDARIDELIKLIYEAAADSSRWNDFLSRFTQALRATSAVFLIHDKMLSKASVSAGAGSDPAWHRPYEEHFVSINPWMQHRFLPGVVEIGEEILSERELVRTEFYNDFLQHQDWLHCCGVLTNEDQSSTSFISALRSKRAGIFTPDEISLFERLAPHLQTAVRIHNRIAGLESSLNAATAALDRFPAGVIIVDSDARMILMNRKGETILQRRDGLTLLSDGLHAAARNETTKLRNAIAAVSSHAVAAVQRPGTLLLISRPSGAKSFEVLVSPLPPSSMLGKGRPAAALFITDPDGQSDLDGQRLRELFGLTPAEIRLVMALVRGQSVEEYAQNTGVSANTARTHVKRIYSKTGVSRQSELVRLLLKSSAGI